MQANSGFSFPPPLLIQIIYSAASIQGLFLSLLLFRTKINQPANRILAILLIIISGHLILVGFDNRDFFLAFPHLSRVSWIIGSLYWPLIFLFVQCIRNFWIFGIKSCVKYVWSFSFTYYISH